MTAGDELVQSSLPRASGVPSSATIRSGALITRHLGVTGAVSPAGCLV